MNGKPTITSSHDIIAPNQISVAANALRDEFGMLNIARLAFNHAGDQHLAFGQLHTFKDCIFMRVARVGSFELDGMRARCPDKVDDILKRHVMMMRPRIIAPTHVHPQPLWRDVGRGVIKCCDVKLHRFAKARKVKLAELCVAAHGEIGAIDLQDDARIRNRLIFVAQPFGDSEDIVFVLVVIFVAEEERGDAGGGGAHEGLSPIMFCERGIEG